MKLRWLHLLLLGCSLAGPRLALAQSAFDPSTMLDASQVRRGDKAVGKTVFAGVKITEFHLEILDVMRQANLDQDMILARVLDGPVVERQCGIVGGMSGSPVYVEGKLIGAIAWGWPFQKEPITGITPIRAMLDALEVMRGPQAQAPPAGPRSWVARRPFVIGGTRYAAAAVTAPGATVPPGVLPLRPVMTPLACSGFGARTIKLIQEKLGPLGIEPMAGGGGQADPVPVELEPGAAVGVRFMEGDFDMTGIGTVTWRQGDRLLAFGHPLMQLGRVKMPLTTAWINEFIANYMRTDKMGSGMANVGTLQADTPFSIGGQVGPQAPLIPARFEIIDRTRNRTRVFNVKVFDEPSLTPVVLSIGISQALEAAYNPGAEGTIRTHFEVKGQRGAVFAHDNQYYMGGSPDKVALDEVTSMMGLLEDNRWDPQGVSKLLYRAELTNRDETAAIEKAYTEENVARAGKPLHVHVLLRPDGGQLQDHTFTLNMPLNLPKGAIRIGIGPGDDALYFRSRFGVMLPQFDSLGAVTDFVRKMEQNKQLCVVVGLPSEGVRVGSTRLMGIPPSIVGVFAKSTRTDVDDGREELFAAEEPGYVLFGRQMLVLATEDRMGARGKVTSETKKPATTKSSSSSSSSAADESTGTQWASMRGLWWAEGALKPAVAARLRAAAAAEGTPWPAAATDDTTSPRKKSDDSDKAGAGKKEEPKPATDAGKDTDKKEEADVKALIRQPKVWLENGSDDFGKGEAKGVALLSTGGLALSPHQTSLGRLKEGYVWNALAHGANTYLATGAPGRVYRVGADSKPELFCDPGVFAVRGLAVNAQGELFLGTWPGGKVFRVGADGKPALFCQLACDYVWALAFDGAGRLLAGTGPDGKLFAMDATGKAEELIHLPQAHIMSLLVQGDRILLGSAAKGVVYELNAQKQLRALLSTGDEHDVTSLVATEDGSVYAASAGDRGAVYRLPKAAAGTTPDPGGSRTLLELKNTPVHGLAAVGNILYAATGEDGKLLAITGEDRYQVLSDHDVTHLLCVTSSADGLVVGTGNAAEAFRIQPAAAAEGFFTSSVLDASRQARWGVVDWQASVPDQAELVIQTRSGQSSDPDDGSWSVWSVPYSHPGQESISSPLARYLQYRVQMKSAAGQAAPQLRWLSVGYLPANQKPTVEFDDDLTVEKPWKGEVEIEWTSADPDKDDLTTTIEYRAAGSVTWQTVKQLGSKDDSYKWKTPDLKDGRYDVRLVVSDATANPGAGLTGEATLYAVQIDNTAPDYLVEKTEAKDGVLTVEGIASDEVRLAEVAFQVGDRWTGAVPVDGLFDGHFEQFRFSVPLDKDGKAKITIRVRDAAGNVKSGELVWPIPPATPAPKEPTAGDKKGDRPGTKPD